MCTGLQDDVEVIISLDVVQPYHACNNEAVKNNKHGLQFGDKCFHLLCTTVFNLYNVRTKHYCLSTSNNNIILDL